MKTFVAEIKKVESKKLVSLDTEIKIVLVSEDSSLLDLGKDPYTRLVKVTVEPVEEGDAIGGRVEHLYE